MSQDINHIVGTDLLDYSFKVEQAIKEGWTFSDANEYAPRAWPHMFEAFMVQGEDYVTLQIPEEKRKETLDALVNAKTNDTFTILEESKPAKTTRRSAKK